ncbi:MAG TPA: M48 family metalloprotease [Chitinophagales bacterium]|nr:M48 family metalloprotease [Chitinophagales bacterium]HNF69961.1 M48 family metalloprotease [Chitinophagales bacterium]
MRNILWRLCLLVMMLSIGNALLYAQTPFEYKYAQDVFNKLIRTINLSSPPKPILEVVPDPNMLATTSGNGKVTIGYQLVNKCRSFGKDSSNALAHVLSHELTHYYQNHFWSEQFGSAYADVGWGEQMQQSGKSLNVMRLYETQADEYGMYYAFSAGYRTLYIGDKVLDSIYTWFHLNEQLPGYPSLTERKQISIEARANIAKLIPVFETGNNCLLLAQMMGGDQQMLLAKTAALQFDDIIARKMQTKEMYNNAAIARLLSVIPMFPDSLQNLQYPFMVETGSILYKSERSRSANGVTDPVMLDAMNTTIDEANTLLNNAVKLDKQFYPAWMNLAILYYLRGAYGSATDALQNASRSMGANNALLWSVDEMRAIIAAAQDDDAEATQLFSSATTKGSQTATYNYACVYRDASNGLIKIDNTLSAYATDTTEMLNGESIFHFMDNLPPNRAGRFDVQNEELVLFTDTTSEYILTYVRANFKPAYSKLRFISSSENPAVKTSKGLRKGDSLQQLIALYGKPSKIFLTGRGEVYAYPAQNIFVHISDEHVSEWTYWWLK